MRTRVKAIAGFPAARARGPHGSLSLGTFTSPPLVTAEEGCAVVLGAPSTTGPAESRTQFAIFHSAAGDLRTTDAHRRSA